MSDQNPYWRIELPAKFMTLPGNLTQREASDTMIRTLKHFIEANLELVEPEPEVETDSAVDVEVQFSDE